MSVNVVRKTMKKLKIVGMQCLVKNSMRYFYTKDDLSLFEKSIKTEKDDVSNSDEHPLVTDKRFLKLSYFPDVRFSEDD